MIQPRESARRTASEMERELPISVPGDVARGAEYPGRTALLVPLGLPGMPESALEFVEVEHCLPLDEIAPLLDRLRREPPEEEGAYPVSDEMEYESKMARLDPLVVDQQPPGELSAYTAEGMLDDKTGVI